jgi:hypothetical protein
MPQSGRCAHYERFEKRPVKGEHMSSGDVEAKKFMGVPIPEEEVQISAHRDGAARPSGAWRVLFNRNTRHLPVLGERKDWEILSAK